MDQKRKAELDAAQAIVRGLKLGSRGLDCGDVVEPKAGFHLVHFNMKYKENEFEVYIIKNADRP